MPLQAIMQRKWNRAFRFEGWMRQKKPCLTDKDSRNPLPRHSCEGFHFSLELCFSGNAIIVVLQLLGCVAAHKISWYWFGPSPTFGYSTRLTLVVKWQKNHTWWCCIKQQLLDNQMQEVYCSPEGVSRVPFKLLVNGSQWKLHMYIIIDKSIHGLMLKVLNQIILIN